MKIFITILLGFSFLNSLSQVDSIFKRFAIGISPLQFISAKEDGLFLQYNLNDKISFEFGGGIYDLIKHPFAAPHVINGFSIRSAIIFNIDCESIRHKYDNGHYYKLLFFYRQMKYKDREYKPNPDAIHENEKLWGDGSDSGNRISKIADELKNVIGIEALFGRKYFMDKKEHFFFDYYGGLGFRVKYRALSITQTHTTSLYNLSPINPPKEENIISYLPSFHLGIKFGYSF